jgi:hypothetical protein
MSEGSVEKTVETLTNEAQNLANAAVDGMQELANHMFDTGEGAAGDALRVVDALVSKASTLQTAVVGTVTKNDQLQEQATAQPGGGVVELSFERLSDQAQAGANRSIDAMQQLANAAIDQAQGAAAPWLHLADTLVTRASALQSSVVGSVSGKLGSSQ